MDFVRGSMLSGSPAKTESKVGGPGIDDGSLQALRSKHGNEAVAAAMASLGLTEKELLPNTQGLLTQTMGSLSESSEASNFRRKIAERKRTQLLAEVDKTLRGWTHNDLERWRLAVSSSREIPPSPWAAEKAAEAERKMQDFQNKQQTRMRHFISELVSNKAHMDEAVAKKVASEQRLRDFRKAREEQIEVKRKELMKKQAKREEGLEKAQQLEQEFRNESAEKLASKFSRSDESRQQQMDHKAKITEERRIKASGKDQKVQEMRQKQLEHGLERMRQQKERDALFAEQQVELQLAREEKARQRHFKFQEKQRNVDINEAQKKAHREAIFHHGNDRLERARNAGVQRLGDFQDNARKVQKKEKDRWEKNWEKVEIAKHDRVIGIMEKSKHHIFSDGSIELQDSDPALRRTWSDPLSIEGRYSPMTWEVLQKQNLDRNHRQVQGHARYLLEKTVAHRRRIEDFRKAREEAKEKRFAMDIQMKMAADAMRQTFAEIDTKPPEKAQQMIRRIGKEYGLDNGDQNVTVSDIE